MTGRRDKEKKEKVVQGRGIIYGKKALIHFNYHVKNQITRNLQTNKKEEKMKDKKLMSEMFDGQI